MFETIGQDSDVIKSKMAARGKFKSGNFFRLLLLLLFNVKFPLSSKICNLDIIWSNLAGYTSIKKGIQGFAGDYKG